MKPHVHPPSSDPPPPRFPSLPIVTPDAPRRSDREKYGGLFFLGALGLVVVIAWVGWFAFSAWRMRDVWAHVYALNDPKKPDAERVQAAYALSLDPRVTDRQEWDLSLNRTLPPLARYLLAEKLTSEAAASDPRGYALSVAKSTGWPDWLRLLLTRPLAYYAADGRPVPRRELALLTENPDPAIALWSAFALAAGRGGDPQASSRLERAAAQEGPNRELARILGDALHAEGAARAHALDRATLWLRTHHEASARVWAGWEIRDGRLVRPPAPELH